MVPEEATGAFVPAWDRARYHLEGVGSLYVHVPFCRSKCAYCDFASGATRADDPLPAAYARAIARQLREVEETGLLDPCRTGYLGGGTPSLLGAALPPLVRAVAPHAPTELSFEANPDSLSPDLLERVREAGATRVSIGVQSTSASELVALGRIHGPERALEALREAVASGLRVSCDLMCAIPRQTGASWERSLRYVLASGVSHVSVYPLAIEEGTAFWRRYGEEEPEFNASDVQADRMEAAEATLTRSGLRRYEVASYAVPGQECLHNVSYWTGAPYLGFGTSAASMLTREGYLALRGVAPQLPAPGDDVARARVTVMSTARQIVADPALGSLRLSVEFLDLRQAVAEDLMLSARLAAGIPGGLLGLAREAAPASQVDAVVSRACDEGLATLEGGRLVPTHSGWLMGNELYGELWGLAEGTIDTRTC